MGWPKAKALLGIDFKSGLSPRGSAGTKPRSSANGGGGGHVNWSASLKEGGEHPLKDKKVGLSQLSPRTSARNSARASASGFDKKRRMSMQSVNTIGTTRTGAESWASASDISDIGGLFSEEHHYLTYEMIEKELWIAETATDQLQITAVHYDKVGLDEKQDPPTPVSSETCVLGEDEKEEDEEDEEE